MEITMLLLKYWIFLVFVNWKLSDFFFSQKEILIQL